MKAVVFETHGGVEVLHWRDWPDRRPAADEVVIKVEAAALNGFDPMGVEVLSAEAGEAAFRLPVRPELERVAGSGQFHGGAIASFIDIAGDFVIAAAVDGAAPIMNPPVDYLRPATGGALLATGQVRELGRTIVVVDIDVEDAAGRLVAIGRGTYGASPR